MVHQQNGLLSDDALTRPEDGDTYDCSIAVIGGSTAAYTTALTALKLRLDVCWVQPQRVVGGQFTAQALPASDDGDLLRHRADLRPSAERNLPFPKASVCFENVSASYSP